MIASVALVPDPGCRCKAIPRPAPADCIYSNSATQNRATASFEPRRHEPLIRFQPPVTTCPCPLTGQPLPVIGSLVALTAAAWILRPGEKPGTVTSGLPRRRRGWGLVRPTLHSTTSGAGSGRGCGLFDCGNAGVRAAAIGARSLVPAGLGNPQTGRLRRIAGGRHPAGLRRRRPSPTWACSACASGLHPVETRGQRVDHRVLSLPRPHSGWPSIPATAWCCVAAALVMGASVCPYATGMSAAEFICTTANRTALPRRSASRQPV